MDFLSETLSKIQQSAVLAAGAKGKVEFFHPEQEPDHVYVSFDDTGSITTHEAEPEPRLHLAASLPEMALYISEKATENSVVWFNGTEVVLICDDGTRRDVVKLGLRWTPQLRRLADIERDKTKFAQDQFVRLMRIDLKGCYSDLRLLNYARACKFTQTAQQGGKVSTDRSSFGKDVDALVVADSGDECPEEITLNVRIFDDPSILGTQEIVCAVELLVHESMFRIVPYPMQVQDAIEREVSAIGDLLRKTVKVPVYRGSP